MPDADVDTFLTYVLRNSKNRALLERLPELALPDNYLVAGCLFQSVWNGLSGFPPEYGIADYDVFYNDPTDLSWDAEDAVIRRCADAFADIEVEIQVRNQARVHLWYEQRFGVPCPPIQSSREAIDTFPNQSSCFGVCQRPDGTFDVYAPFGFADLFDMVLRPNPARDLRARYYEKADRWRAVWPDLRVLPWPVA